MKKIDNFKKALKNMEVIYKYNPPFNPVELSGIINLFSICFEACWKALEEYLEESGFQELRSPRTVLKTAYRQGLIDDEELWLQALKDRNLATQVHDSEYESFTETIKKIYIPLFRKVYDRLEFLDI